MVYELGIWASSLANSYPEPEGPGDGAGEAELTFALVVLQCLGGASLVGGSTQRAVQVLLSLPDLVTRETVCCVPRAPQGLCISCGSLSLLETIFLVWKEHKPWGQSPGHGATGRS